MWPVQLAASWGGQGDSSWLVWEPLEPVVLCVCRVKKVPGDLDLHLHPVQHQAGQSQLGDSSAFWDAAVTRVRISPSLILFPSVLWHSLVCISVVCMSVISALMGCCKPACLILQVSEWKFNSQANAFCIRSALKYQFVLVIGETWIWIAKTSKFCRGCSEHLKTSRRTWTNSNMVFYKVLQVLVHGMCSQSVYLECGSQVWPIPGRISLYVVIRTACGFEFLSLGAVERLYPTNLVEHNRAGTPPSVIVWIDSMSPVYVQVSGSTTCMQY